MMTERIIIQNLSFIVGVLVLLALITWGMQRIAAWAVRRIGESSIDDERQLMGPERREEVTAGLLRSLWMLSGLAAVGLVAGGIYAAFAGIDLPERAYTVFQTLSWTMFRPFAVSASQFIGVIVLLQLAGWLSKLLSQWIVERLIAAEIVRVEDKRVQQVGDRLLSTLRWTLWYVGALMGVYIFDMTASSSHIITITAELILVYSLVRLMALSIGVALDAVYAGLVLYWNDDVNVMWESRAHIHSLSERIRMALQWTVYIAALMYVGSRVSFGGYQIGERTLDSVFYEIANASARVIAIWIVAMVVVEACALIIHRYSLKPDAQGEVPKRRKTVLPLLVSVVRYGVYFIAAVTALNVVGVDTTAILAGAGIVGIAIGFGAQHLIQDFVAGFFILFEGYFWVGDWVETGEYKGIVESITLRSTWVRDPDGMVHIIPNGEIRVLTNYSRTFVKASMDVGVSYEGDVERAIAVTNETMLELKAQMAEMTGAPEVLVKDFGGSDIVLRVRVPVEPGMHERVASAMRRAIKAAYDDNGIEIPFSRHVLIFQQPDGTQLDELPIRIVGDEAK